jgi:hypothetical protein
MKTMDLPPIPHDIQTFNRNVPKFLDAVKLPPAFFEESIPDSKPNSITKNAIIKEDNLASLVEKNYQEDGIDVSLLMSPGIQKKLENVAMMRILPKETTRDHVENAVIKSILLAEKNIHDRMDLDYKGSKYAITHVDHEGITMLQVSEARNAFISELQTDGPPETTGISTWHSPSNPNEIARFQHFLEEEGKSDALHARVKLVGDSTRGIGFRKLKESINVVPDPDIAQLRFINEISENKPIVLIVGASKSFPASLNPKDIDNCLVQAKKTEFTAKNISRLIYNAILSMKTDNIENMSFLVIILSKKTQANLLFALASKDASTANILIDQIDKQLSIPTPSVDVG